MMGYLCRGAYFMVHVGHYLYIEFKCTVICVGNRRDEIVMHSVIIQRIIFYVLKLYWTINLYILLIILYI